MLLCRASFTVMKGTLLVDLLPVLTMAYKHGHIREAFWANLNKNIFEHQTVHVSVPGSALTFCVHSRERLGC
jgi:hypothetical protein